MAAVPVQQILPNATELAGLDTLEKIVNWTGLDVAVAEVLWKALGNIGRVRLLALVPVEVLQKALKAVRIEVTPGIPATTSAAAVPAVMRELFPVEAIQLALVWRVARQAFNLPDIDPLDPTPMPPAVTPTAPAPVAVTGGGKVGGSPTKKVKTSTVVDQMDDTEFEILSNATLDQCFRNHVSDRINLVSTEVVMGRHEDINYCQSIVKRGGRIIKRGQQYHDFK